MEIIYKIYGNVVSKTEFENFEMLPDSVRNRQSVLGKIDKLLSLPNEPQTIVYVDILKNNSIKMEANNCNDCASVYELL